MSDPSHNLPVATLMLRIREGCSEPYVEFYVDGANLGERVMAALGEDGFDDVLPWPGGDYSVENTVLGESARRHGSPDAVLFACGCGHLACSSVSVTVEVNRDTLVFTRFRTFRRGGEIVAPLGPIAFERQQYDDAVRQFEQALQSWRPTWPDTKQQI